MELLKRQNWVPEWKENNAISDGCSLLVFSRDRSVKHGDLKYILVTEAYIASIKPESRKESFGVLAMHNPYPPPAPQYVAS